jgi:hypothetical protein
MLILLSLHKQAFINYYFTVIGALLVAVVAGEREAMSTISNRKAASVPAASSALR